MHCNVQNTHIFIFEVKRKTEKRRRLDVIEINIRTAGVCQDDKNQVKWKLRTRVANLK